LLNGLEGSGARPGQQGLHQPQLNRLGTAGFAEKGAEFQKVGCFQLMEYTRLGRHAKDEGIDHLHRLHRAENVVPIELVDQRAQMDADGAEVEFTGLMHRNE
jgi:hypothetical protein